MFDENSYKIKMSIAKDRLNYVNVILHWYGISKRQRMTNQHHDTTVDTAPYDFPIQNIDLVGMFQVSMHKAYHLAP